MNFRALPIHTFIIITTVLIAAMSAFQSARAQDKWETPFERSGGTQTPTYEETIAYLLRIAGESRWVKPQLFGVTPQGRDMVAFFCSKYDEVSPATTAKSDLPLVLIMGGIHAGEMDGKDAGMMLLREIAVTKSLEHLLNSANILFIPVFNIDGHERRSKYNRINQDGPEVMGWRTTSQNLNLNRDFLKADAPEMRAWLDLVREARPDVIIDCHVTDGIDFQYNMTYAMEMFANAPWLVRSWQADLERAMTAAMAAQNDPIFPYAFPREEYDLSQGVRTWAAPPRFSTGYAAIRNRVGILLEAHSLKPFKTRVESTYRILVEIMKYVNISAGELKEAVRRAERTTVADFHLPRDTSWYPLRFAHGEGSTPVEYRTYESTVVASPFTGGSYQQWDHSNPITLTVPYWNDLRPSLLVRPPRYYLIPQQWQEQIELLRAHGVAYGRLPEAVTLPCSRYRFTNVKFRETPVEGRHTVTFDTEEYRDTVTYPAGTYVVSLEQPEAKIAVHLLEPGAPDSFVYWGFFNAIFEQKEYFEEYAMEPLAQQMIAENPALGEAFTAKKLADTTFAKSQRAMLGFFYERSPWWDTEKNVYPVGRVYQATLNVVPAHEYRNKHILNRR